MARRRNNDPRVEAIAIFMVLFALLFVFNPAFRNLVLAIGFGLSAVVVIGGLAFFALKNLKKKPAIQGNLPVPRVECPPRMPTDEEKYGPKLGSFVLPTDYITPPEPEIDPIERLRKIDWYQFEKLVAWVYEKQGFDVTRKGGANPDGGIDLIITKNGRQSGVQCKHWKTWDLGVKTVREFLGALTDARFQHGILVTLNGYTGEAKLLAERHGIEIVNEAGLRSMLANLDWHDPNVLQILNDTRKICPKCEREMVLRIAGKGPNRGQRFWGCPAYPRCNGKMPY